MQQQCQSLNPNHAKSFNPNTVAASFLDTKFKYAKTLYPNYNGGQKISNSTSHNFDHPMAHGQKNHPYSTHNQITIHLLSSTFYYTPTKICLLFLSPTSIHSIILIFLIKYRSKQQCQTLILTLGLNTLLMNTNQNIYTIF